MEIPGYKLVKEIGSGGMATVYLAVQENLHRQVALKVMTPGLAVDETYCKRFLKEGRIAAQLTHTNLLTVYDIGVHENHYYMASEYLPGGTVRDRMKTGMSPEQVVHVVTDIAQGLQFAHSKGFVHRDVKPGNMLFRANGDCVLGDFGIAKAVDSNTGATKLGTSIGTPHYMSPEQAKGEKVDHRTDLYSLGVVFYEMLSGKLPFDADDPFSVALMQINDPMPPLPVKFQSFQPVIEKLMTKDREQRYGAADDFLDDLEAVSGTVSPSRKTTKRRIETDSAGSGPARPPSPPRRGRSGRRSRPIVPVAIGGAALLALIVALALGFGKFGKGPDPDARPSDDPMDEPSSGEEIDVPLARARHAMLMNEAAASIDAGRYLSPAGDNALERYREILAEDPEHDGARLALRELANQIEAAAEAAWERGELNQAYALLGRARVEFPDDQGIAYLLTRIEQEFEDQGLERPVLEAGGSGSDPRPGPEQQRVAQLIRQADQYFDANVYSHPPGRNAMDVYLEVLKLDPANKRANERLARIADLWANAAETNLERGNVDLAQKMIEKGLQARPDHPQLQALLERTDAAQR